MSYRYCRLAATLFLLCIAAVHSISRAADSASDFDTLPGFKLETVFEADKDVHGSWISLGKDEQGRLLLGGQRRQPLTRLTIDSQGKVAKVEVLKLPVSEIMGQLVVGDALYVSGAGKGPDGKDAFGLFRLRDPGNTGSYTSVELLRAWDGGFGEHGAHGIVLGPDKQHLFVVCGNMVNVPTDLAPTSPHRNYADDLALPRAEDGNGFAAGRKPPGGFIARMDLDGRNVELFASGQRNTYDIAINADGEIFGFDSDMEDDWGTPWYRPIRIFHATSGGEGGFREGTAKWPEYYADSLPAVIDIGIGCPTGVLFGAGAKFPARYQKALYMHDWTYGRLIAAHLKPKGASYECTGFENLVAPKGLHGDGTKTPLNLTDMVIGADGALYFTIGGRSTTARLYRVSYVGNESTAPSDLHDSDGAEARALRHKLEAFHGRVADQAVETAWPRLDSEDRYIRFAARIAIEAQPIERWKAKALAESRPRAALTALLALARLGGTETQAELLSALARLPMSGLSTDLQLDKLRVLEVSIARSGVPAAKIADPIIAELNPIYPGNSVELNRELCQVLLALNAPGALEKTVRQLGVAETQEEQITYLLALRTIKAGWTPELRRAYFSWWTKDHAGAKHPAFMAKWFEDAGRPYGNGRSYEAFISNLHRDATASLTPAEYAQLTDVIEAFKPIAPKKQVKFKTRTLVREWTMADLEPLYPQISHGRNFERGRRIFEEAQCMACHKFGDQGGVIGPDLTAVASRFARKDIVESIILPSKVISEQFAATRVKTKNGNIEEGRIVEETADHIVLQPNQLMPETIKIKKADIVVRKLSDISPMPQGLVNTFTVSEILDLVAYLESGGRKEHRNFTAAPAGN